jgi:GNAT superfamily N-acetyltransferase
VFFREYAAADRDLCGASTPSPLAAGIEVGRLDPADEKGVWEYAAAVARGFVADGSEPEAADVSLTARVVRTQHVSAYAARAEGRIVGGGAIEVPPGGGAKATALFALSVLPAYRRKGVQQALIAARLRAGAEAGGTVATISALPGVATERNARRMGFQVAYTKAVMVRPGEGLKGSRW